jgi:hypothetical protein
MYISKSVKSKAGFLPLVCNILLSGQIKPSQSGENKVTDNYPRSCLQQAFRKYLLEKYKLHHCLPTILF